MRENRSLQLNIVSFVQVCDACLPDRQATTAAQRTYAWSKKGIFICVLFFSFFISFGQDLHFSQFFNSPLTTNPANTGFIPDADYRIGANYRS
ncbi:MAG TPA: hypothetical protein VK645_08370, partial [Chitinophagaceae bacterium]|nr:hypothetical protein [Chitinophagaceae bacterium]